MGLEKVEELLGIQALLLRARKDRLQRLMSCSEISEVFNTCGCFGRKE